MSYLQNLNEWLNNNSFNLTDFENLNQLELLKNKLGHTVSVVIPTYNHAFFLIRTYLDFGFRYHE